MTPLREMFPHCLSHEDIAGPGPSPTYICSRPSCALRYRTLSFTRVVPPPCPMCGQPYIPASNSLLRSSTLDWALSSCAQKVDPVGPNTDLAGRHVGAR